MDSSMRADEHSEVEPGAGEAVIPTADAKV